MAIYNVRLFDYANSQQLRLYKRPIIVKDRKESKNEETEKKDKEDCQENGENNDKSIDKSIYIAKGNNRAKQAVYELTRANTWDWFITLTFDPKKTDRTDYDALVKTVGKWFNNIRQRKCPNMKYILVPELHKDGKSYHFHGLLADADGLRFVDSGIEQNGKRVYNMPDYKLGFTTATKVEDTNKVSSYIVKYITKELESRIKGKRRYIASKNCARARVIDYNLTPEQINDLLDSISEEITHMKSQSVPHACQLINYIELKKDP